MINASRVQAFLSWLQNTFSYLTICNYQIADIHASLYFQNNWKLLEKVRK